MKDARREERPLTVRMVVEYAKNNHAEFVKEYCMGKKHPYNSLKQAVRRVVYAHGLKQRRSTKSKLTSKQKNDKRVLLSVACIKRAWEKSIFLKD